MSEQIHVRHRDVMQCAKKSCSHCYGKGEIVVYGAEITTDARGKKHSMPGPARARVCGCALKRFKKLQPVTIDPKTGAMYFAAPYLLLTDETKAEHERSTGVGDGVVGTQGDVAGGGVGAQSEAAVVGEHGAGVGSGGDGVSTNATTD